MIKKLAIVGGGVAGLSAGIYGQKLGLSTVILEKNAVAGGNLCGWNRNGYHIDNCLHWLVGTRPGTKEYRIFETLGALGPECPVYRPDTFYSSEGGGERIAFYRDLERTRQEMLALSPEDSGEIQRFCRAVSAVAESVRESGSVRSLWNTGRRWLFSIPYFRMPLKKLAERFRHPLLSAAFTDYIGGDFTSLGLILAYGAFTAGNGDLPVGGSARMAERIAARYRFCGGDLRTEAEVTGVEWKQGKIRSLTLSTGEEIAADGFLFTCDPAVTFGRLLPPETMPKRLLTYYQKRREFPVFSALQAAFAVSVERLPFRGSTAIPVLPFLSDGRFQNRLCLREFSHEPNFAPERHSLFQCLIYQRQSAAREWLALSADKERYREHKTDFGETLRERVEAYYPSLAGKIQLLDVWTPATYHRYFGGFYGAFMSFAITGQAIPFPVSPELPGIRNARLCTQWLLPPGGVPFAAEIGKTCAEWFAGRNEAVPFSV